jgi:hypothetical protein
MAHTRLYFQIPSPSGSGLGVRIPVLWRFKNTWTDEIVAIATNTSLYITGGEYFEPDDTGAVVAYAQHGTRIIDLTQSWTNQTVGATTVAEPTGMIVRKHLWLIQRRHPSHRIAREVEYITDLPLTSPSANPCSSTTKPATKSPVTAAGPTWNPTSPRSSGRLPRAPQASPGKTKPRPPPTAYPLIPPAPSPPRTPSPRKTITTSAATCSSPTPSRT